MVCESQRAVYLIEEQETEYLKYRILILKKLLS